MSLPANLPEALKNLVDGYAWNQVTIGESTASTYRLERSGYPAIYLKIDLINPRRQLPAEKVVLNWLAGKLSVPEVLYFGDIDGTDYLLMSALPGLNAVDMIGKIPNNELVRLLAQGLRIVHSVSIDACPFDWSLNKAIKVAELNVRYYLVHESDFDQERRGKTAPELINELHRLRPPDEDLVFTHGDYCLPNIMIDMNRISGFIDLSKAGIADRYQDLALGMRSIRYNLGPGFEQTFLSEYGITEPDLKKIEYYKLLDEFY